jgi:ABC-type Fe3+-hydroxamate transport system substrate-binding protein
VSRSAPAGEPRRPAEAGHLSGLHRRDPRVRLKPDTRALVDAAGVEHAPAGAEARIVCLVPSITELLCDLGLAGQLVGRTGFCIHPRDVVKTIPKVGGTKDVRLDRIRELAPTHAVVNVDENRLEDVEELATFVPSIVVTHPLGPLDNPPLYRLLGGVFGRDEEAEALCARFDEALAEVAAADRPERDVLYLIWREPWMTVSRDTYIARTLELVGWRTLPAETEERYPTVELPRDGKDADLVLLPSEPYRFRAKHVPELEALLPHAQVSLVDGEATSWYGSRAIAGIRAVAALADDLEKLSRG